MTDPSFTAAAAATDKGERARARLLAEASRLFAEKGYAKAATREICEAAGANVAAIHYHFGGKEGLYREVLLGPIQGLAAQFAGFDDPALPLRDALARLLAAFVGTDDAAAPGADIGMRLFLREMIEPTPVFAATVARYIGPHHEAMARLFARHIGMPEGSEPDEDVHRLVFGVIAMAHDYCVSREFMAIVAPRLLAGADPMQRARERLIDWALALVAHEAERRGLPRPKAG
ncbi:MAG TPA: CerR family C-terminal domain-containing protein [Burkholderiaceae bacterium]|nr:CerR family C-terminal domain-containing protein [Burkholderiaceae bacterium]